MSLYQLIQTYGKGKGESVMWDSVQLISDKLDEILSEEDYQKLLKKVYCKMSGVHFNDMFAKQQVSNMYFTDKYDVKHQGPFISESEVTQMYEKIRSKISNYNIYDFYVTVQMIYSDKYNMLIEWFGDIPKDDLTNKVMSMAVNWLNDDDNPFGSEKIWGYFNK